MHLPSIDLVGFAVVALGSCVIGLAIVLYLFMQIHHRLRIARGTRRVILEARLVPAPKREDVQRLWLQSSEGDREILGDILADRCQLADPVGSETLRQAVAEAGVLDHWLNTLRTAPRPLRVRAALWLGCVRDERAVAALAQAAEDPSAEVRRAVALGLGRLQDPGGIPGLMSLAQRPRSEMPDLTLAAALAGCAKGCPEQLTPLLRAPGARQRQVAAWALSEVATPGVLPELLLASHDRDPEVRAKVARALARIPGTDSAPILVDLANDPVWFVRVRALAALGRRGSPAGEEAALRGLDDKVREVRYRAAYALRQARGMKGAVMTQVLNSRPRRSFNSLISEWDRAGFLWSLMQDLKPAKREAFLESWATLRSLVTHGYTRALVHLVLAYPDVKTRLRLLRILLSAGGPKLRDQLMSLVGRPECDPWVAAAIRRASQPVSN
jgi:HEAT repeat protein